MYFFFLADTTTCSRYQGFRVDQRDKNPGAWAAYILAEPVRKTRQHFAHLLHEGAGRMINLLFIDTNPGSEWGRAGT